MIGVKDEQRICTQQETCSIYKLKKKNRVQLASFINFLFIDIFLHLHMYQNMNVYLYGDDDNRTRTN